MMRIHLPVEEYSEVVGAKVQRMFNAIKPGRGLWRTNAFSRASYALFRPRLEAEKYAPPEDDEVFIRSERQCLIRLPKTQAIVFSIHTRIVTPSALTKDQADMLSAHPIKLENT